MKPTHLLILIPLLLVTALYSAVARIGWSLPMPSLPVHHGFLMVSGLFGTLISLERTLILKNRFWLGIPSLSSLAAVCVIAGFPEAGFGLQVLAALLLSFLYFKQWKQYREVYFIGLILSSLAWTLSGVVLLLGSGYPAASMWYVLFLLFTIASERLELSKFRATPPWARPLIVILFILLFLAQVIPFHWGAQYINGVLIAALALWLMEFDMVKINLRKKGFFRYTGVTLFGGYMWLMLSGALMLLPVQTFYHYDAVLHSFFIGFVFSMLFAHAPIIFPALVRQTIRPFHTFFYGPVMATHALLLFRLYADYTTAPALRKWTGLLQVLVFLIFFISFLVVFKQKLKTKQNTTDP